jgi:excinuclease UvrABC helicase subunit UvrB
MRHSATRALLERDDVIIVASVSCIYGIGSVETYTAMTFQLEVGERIDQRQLLADLVALQYKRNDINFQRGTFRVRGDTIEVFPAHLRTAPGGSRFFGDEIEEPSPSSTRSPARRPAPEERQDLRQLALRHAAPDAEPGDQARSRPS